MNVFHTDLENRWQNFTIFEQMANIGAEVGRTMSWRKKKNEQMWQNALYRALELIDLTAADPKNRASLKEILRLREVLLDHTLGKNTYNSTDEIWNKYFYPFNYAVRRNH